MLPCGLQSVLSWEQSYPEKELIIIIIIINYLLGVVALYIFNKDDQTSFLNALFLTGLGMTVYNAGNVIRQINDGSLSFIITDVPAGFALLFAGSFLAILFWVNVQWCSP